MYMSLTDHVGGTKVERLLERLVVETQAIVLKPARSHTFQFFHWLEI